MSGRLVLGLQLGFASYVTTGLHMRVTQLADARWLATMARIFACGCMRSDTINATLARYVVVRARTARIGNCVVSWGRLRIGYIASMCSE